MRMKKMAYATVFVLVVLVLTGSGPTYAYTFETPKWVEESNAELGQRQAEAQAARERVAKEEAEKQAKASQEHHEQEEHVTQEERKAQEEAERKETMERESEEQGEPKSSSCVVPALERKSLSEAQRVLRRAHCRLGRVSKPRGRHGHIVVVSQHPDAGAHLSRGKSVTVTLGVAGARKGR